MVKKEEFYYSSYDRKTKIYAIKWIPKDREIRAILHIAHGMLEFIDRYDELAQFLAKKGILVVGNDHLGHGYSVFTEEDRGYFCENDGNNALIEDMHELMNITKKQYPKIPYYILGHSMGSFLVRQFITIYKEGLKGAIIVGTGCQSYLLLKLGKLITKIISFFRGWRYRSKFVNNLALGDNNKNIEIVRTSCDWLTRDEKIVDDYINDYRTNYIFTVNAYYNMFKGILYLYDKNNLYKMNKELPILFMSGESDVVGDFGKAPKKVYDNFKQIGMNNISIKLYEEARHEIINELQRDDVYMDILEWIDKNI